MKMRPFKYLSDKKESKKQTWSDDVTGARILSLSFSLSFSLFLVRRPWSNWETMIGIVSCRISRFSACENGDPLRYATMRSAATAGARTRTTGQQQWLNAIWGICSMHILYTLACEWSNVESERERERRGGRSERLGRTSGIRGIVYYLPRARNREQFSCFGHWTDVFDTFLRSDTLKEEKNWVFRGVFPCTEHGEVSGKYIWRGRLILQSATKTMFENGRLHCGKEGKSLCSGRELVFHHKSLFV